MLLIIIPLVLLVLAYSSWGLARLAPAITGLRWGIAGGWMACFLAFVLCFLLRKSLSTTAIGIIYPLVCSWLVIALYVFMGLVLIDILRLIPSLRGNLGGSWYLLGGFVLVLTALFVYARQCYLDKVPVSLDIRLDKTLPKPLKIIGLSDLHLGYTIGKDELASWVEKINAEKPDLVIIAGDIVDGDTRPLLEQNFAEVLNRIEAPIYACLGNHEYMGSEGAEQTFLSQTKVQVLRDRVAYLPQGLYIIGRDDYSKRYTRMALKDLAKGLDADKPLLVLDHQPYELEEAEGAGIDFQLSGHTHSGQVFPLNVLVNRLYEVAHGYKQKGGTHIYVSSGMGIWGGRFRIGTQSEYLILNLSGRMD